MAKKKILAVDDDATALGALRQILVQKGYEVSTAPNGHDALTALGTGSFDLVILDVSMPGLSGYEVCRKIRQDDKTQDLPVIFLTAKGMLVDMTEGEERGQRSLPGEARAGDQAAEHGRHVPLRRHAPGQEAPRRPHPGLGIRPHAARGGLVRPIPAELPAGGHAELI